MINSKHMFTVYSIYYTFKGIILEIYDLDVLDLTINHMFK